MLGGRRVLCRVAACATALGASACSLLVPLDELADGETGATSVAQGSGGAGAAGPGAGGAASTGGVTSASSGGMTDGGAASTYAAAVLTDTPVAYWRLGESELPVAVDASGNGHDCTYSEGVLLGAPGAVPRDTAASFDGRTASVNCGVVMPFVSGAPFSIEAWILAEGDGSGVYRRMVSAEYQSADNKRQGFGLWAHFTARGGVALGFQVWRDQVQICDVEYFPLTPDVLHHVVAVHDGQDAIVYIDAEARLMTCDGQTIADGETPWFLGRQSDAQYGYWRGTLDEIAIYASALSSDRVSAHFGARRGGP